MIGNPGRISVLMASAVEAEVAAVAVALSALLEQEQQMLIKGEVDQLLELLGEKNGLAAQLDQPRGAAQHRRSPRRD
ncbi:MAG: hypothetical protein V5B38_21345 [Candidatus Accumulibacter propinquus]